MHSPDNADGRASSAAPPATLFGWFARSARDHPREIAIDAPGRRVSYADLDRLSALQASRLARIALRPGARVGLAGPARPETYAAYLGILRLGHTVVPLSLDAPLSRNAAITSAAGLAAVMLDATVPGGLAGQLASQGIPVLGTDPDSSAPASRSEPEPSADPGGVAYLLFTSGSTGRPKGVPIGNPQVSAYLAHVIPASGLRPGMRSSQTFSLTFDPSVFDLFATWGAGATLVPPDRRELLMPARYVARRQLTHWYSVPSLVSYAIRAGSLAPGSMPELQRSMFIGERLTLRQAAAWHEAAPASLIENVYGPVELTVSCSAFALPRDRAQWPATSNGTVPIGAVYPHLEWLVAAADGTPGESGELLVRGPQRFGGYLEPADSRGRFGRVAPQSGRVVPAPPGAAPGDFYRTGDRVRLLRDGVLVHLGRIDRMAKVDGYRIELAEVETALRHHPQVTDAAVVAVQGEADESAVLAGALCGSGAGHRDIAAFLAGSLPRYMVPRVIFWIPEMPLNISGKTDYAQIASMAAARLHEPG